MPCYHEILAEAAQHCDADGCVSEGALDAIHDEAYMRACELDSPNSIGFDKMQEGIEEKLQEELFKKAYPNA